MSVLLMFTRMPALLILFIDVNTRTSIIDTVSASYCFTDTAIYWHEFSVCVTDTDLPALLIFFYWQRFGI